MKPNQIITALFLAILAVHVPANRSAASTDDHNDDDPHGATHEEQTPMGPHGGRVFRDGDIALELVMHERGVPPRFRAWVTRAGEPVTDNMELVLEATRLDGRREQYRFENRGADWLGDRSVPEPHSFDLEVSLHLGGVLYQWRQAMLEGRTTIDERIAAEAGIRSAMAGPGLLERKQTVYGRIISQPGATTHVRARFPGVVTAVAVTTGDDVTIGTRLATIEADQSLNTYTLDAPMAGTVAARDVSVGELTGDRVLFTLVDPGAVRAELNVYPGQVNRVREGQTVRVTGLTGDQSGRVGVINHLVPSTEASVFTRALVDIDNKDFRYTIGELVQFDIVIETIEAGLVVERRAVHTLDGRRGVFIQVGHDYEFRPLALGRDDGARVEVLDGLRVGERYVVDNSFLVRADIEKAGAGHDH